MSDDFFSVPATCRNGPGRRRRTKFAIAHYECGKKLALLIIPGGNGIAIGDRISYYKTNSGISFRVEENGNHIVYRNGAAHSSTMRAALCQELAECAIFKSRDIICKKIDGGWFVPFSQFE